ncbi:MAG: citramalate synthase [Hyphomicrobiaceae bacterium]
MPCTKATFRRRGLSIKDRIFLFDTTMRDGAQTVGISFQLADKLRIAVALDDLGIDYVEAGFPGSNPTDTAFFDERPALSHARLTAFGMTRRVGATVTDDGVLQAVLKSNSDAICLVGKSSDYHARVALGITGEDNLTIIRESVAAAAATGRDVTLNCEHYFDGFKANPAYSLSVVQTAFEAGARWVSLCDTNGGSLPLEIEQIVTATARVVPGEHLGIHTHDDTGHAVANTFAAIGAGCRQIQGTLNGIGERCGNANLTTIIPTLLLKPALADRFECAVTSDQLRRLRHASLLLDEILGRTPNAQAPYVGDFAFATKCGIHASGLAKDRGTYEHILPESVGNAQRVLVSNQAGRSNLLTALRDMGMAVDEDDPQLDRLLETVKTREAAGYAYDLAPASFELLVRRAINGEPASSEDRTFRIAIEQCYSSGVPNAPGLHVQVQTTTEPKSASVFSRGSGSELVTALLDALCNAHGSPPGGLDGLSLDSTQFRTLATANGQMVRVVVAMRDNAMCPSWSCIGVAPDVTSAAMEALLDGIAYKRHRDAARSGEGGAAVTSEPRRLRQSR